MPWTQVCCSPVFLQSLFHQLSYRFFETSGTVILVMLLSRYKIDVIEEPKFAGESFEQKRDRVLTSTAGLTQTYAFSCASPISRGSMMLIGFVKFQANSRSSGVHKKIGAARRVFLSLCTLT